MKTLFLLRWQSGKMEWSGLHRHRPQIQVRRGRVKRAGIGQCPDSHAMLGIVDEMRANEVLSPSIRQNRATARRGISRNNPELKARRKWQWDDDYSRKLTAGSIDQGLLGDSKDSRVD